MAEALPSIRVKLPCQDGREFLDRHATRVASKGVQIPTARMRPIGSRVRLVLELRSGELVSGDAVVESHVRLREASGLSLRYVRLDEGDIAFPLAAAAGAVASAAAERAAPAPPPTLEREPDLEQRPEPPIRVEDLEPLLPEEQPPEPAAPEAFVPPPLRRGPPTRVEDLEPLLPEEQPPEPAAPEAIVPPPLRQEPPIRAEDLEPLLPEEQPPEAGAPQPTAPPVARRRAGGRAALAAAVIAAVAALVWGGSRYLVRARHAAPPAAADRRAAEGAPAPGDRAPGLGQGSVAATCARASGTVEVRRAGATGWQPLAVTATLGAGDLVRTGPASSAQIAFASGGALDLEESATIEIGDVAPDDRAKGEASPPEGAVDVQAGVVRGVLPASQDARAPGLVIRGADGSKARLATSGSEPAAFRVTRARGGTEVAVTEGEAHIQSARGDHSLRAGRAFEVSGAGVARVVDLLAFPASIGPGVDARFRWTKDLEVRLAWSPVPGAAGYRVQISRSLSFETVANTLDVDATEVAFKPPEGMFAWRVASRDEAGRYGEYGFARRVYCERDVPQDLLVGPADRALIRYAEPSSSVAFTWQSAANATVYRLVVATSRDLLAKPVVSRLTREQRLHVKGLAPGEYFWGVFVSDGRSPEPIFQKPRALFVQRVAKAKAKAQKGPGERRR